MPQTTPKLRRGQVWRSPRFKLSVAVLGVISLSGDNEPTVIYRMNGHYRSARLAGEFLQAFPELVSGG